MIQRGVWQITPVVWGLLLSQVALADKELSFERYAPIIAASQRRSEAAQQKLKDCRARRDALEKRRSELGKQIQRIAGRLKVSLDPEHAKMQEQIRAAENRIRDVSAQLKNLQPESFERLDQMIEYDRLTDELAAQQIAVQQSQQKLQAMVHKLVRRDPEGAKVCDEWESLVAPLVATENELKLAQFDRDAIVRAEASLQNSLKRQPEPTLLPGTEVIRLEVAPPADADARRKVFAERASSASVTALGRRFFSQMSLSEPGLERVEAFVNRGDFAAALEAYKRFFFARLCSPKKPSNGSVASDLEEKDSEGDTTEAIAAPLPPTKAAISDALAGRVVGNYQAKGRLIRIEATLGLPGAMRWAFVDEQSIDGNPNAEYLLDLCRRQNYPGMTGVALLNSYGLGGPKEHLDRWVEILDDWSLNWQQDAEQTHLALRDYNLLCVYRIKESLARLRNLAVMRSEFVEDLPAATLARLLMALNDEYISAAVRLGRSGLYNFRIMALNGMISTSLKLPEFHVHQWAVREGWRQVDDNFIYKIRRDGANFEFANDGHENTDQALMLPFRAIQALNPTPDWLEPCWDAEFTDNFLSNTRYWVHNLKQDGFSYRLNHRTQQMRYLGAHPEYKVNMLMDEPEVRRRLWQVMHVGKPEPPPQVNSESMGYQGYYYLRSGWDRDDDFLYFQSIGQPILSGREDNTGYSLYGKGSIFLLSPAPTVDGKTQNVHYGLVQNPGGKAHFAAYGKPDVVQEGRFHADDRFDLAEGTFDGVYQYHRPDAFFDSFGSYGYESSLAKAQGRAAREGKPFVDEPIRDVRQTRQILSVRGRETYIVTDTFDSEQPHQFTQDYTIYTPIRMDQLPKRVALLDREKVSLLHVDDKQQTLATCNVGLQNLRLQHIGAVPVKYSVPEDRGFASLVSSKGDPQSVSKSFTKREKHHTEAAKLLQLHRKVAVHWQARGPHVLITLVTPQKRSYQKAVPQSAIQDLKPITQSQEIAGFTGRFEDGATIGYLAASKPAELRLPGVTATASALLVCDGHGVALDCTKITAGEKAVLPETTDFTFRIDGNQIELDKPIYRPIQPVTIEPAANVFIDATSVSLSCPTPDVELRYTLDGTRPTPQSPLYTIPIEVRDTCRLKVRAFRKGVTEDIWQQDGTHASVVYSAVFRKEAPAAAAKISTGAPGLAYEYFEGIWTELMAHSLTIPAQESGVVPKLLDVSPRKTKGTFGIRYSGLIEVPRDGVYTFYAPREFIYPDIESGYDLRVFVDGREWYPAVRWNGHGTWSVALKKGRHAFKVVFVDMRPKPHKVELMWGFPHPEFTWKGDAPTLEISGPGLARQPITPEMLSHSNGQ